MEIAIWLAVWAVPILIGYVFGRAAERRHFRSISAREKELMHVPTTAMRVSLSRAPVARCELVRGNVVISVDYFKRAVAGLRSLIGGPVGSYESLLDRARREAVLRLKESCPGAHEIVNLRLETAAISNNAQGGVGSVEVLAYATALYFAGPVASG